MEELTSLTQQSTPQGRLRSSFITEEEEEATATPLPVQRKLFPVATTPAKRKQSRLLQELEEESESEKEEVGRVKGKAREQAELPYVISDEWNIGGKTVTAFVLYAGNQAIPVLNMEVAALLGKLYESVIHESKTNVSLSTSMSLLDIPANTVLRMDPMVMCLTGEGAEKSLENTGMCNQLQNRSALKKLVRAAAKLYDTHDYLQTSHRMPLLFHQTGLPTYVPCRYIASKLTQQGQAAFNAPTDGEVPCHRFTSKSKSKAAAKEDDDDDDDDAAGAANAR
ncbi:hypothetical protein TrVFT333_001857 [Trichoderma virens FT-333]|nr:hypothetical protein TrVFT333_001857 [Trichoderma virens FT-333]